MIFFWLLLGASLYAIAAYLLDAYDDVMLDPWEEEED